MADMILSILSTSGLFFLILFVLFSVFNPKNLSTITCILVFALSWLVVRKLEEWRDGDGSLL